METARANRLLAADVKPKRSPATLLPPLLLIPAVWGCSALPEVRHRDSLHNPFPQLKRVAVLPFFNQSDEPTLNTESVAESYYAALQSIPGFEVIPVGVTKTQLMAYARQHGEPRSGMEFQRFARFMDVEAVVVGSVTDFTAYYPPQMALTVRWYAANEGFHPIPPGYGLPWGTESEEEIPKRIVREAEFELARSQLATQTPVPPTDPAGLTEFSGAELASAEAAAERAAADRAAEPDNAPGPDTTGPDRTASAGESAGGSGAGQEAGDSPRLADSPHPPGLGGAGTSVIVDDPFPALPPDWPSPSGLIPDGPSPQRPAARITHEPVLTHTRLYRGDDPYFTSRLADHVETGDDARPGGWQGYLSRSDDFIRFCCHLHITEMLESRGGRDQSDLILRWPLSRY